MVQSDGSSDKTPKIFFYGILDRFIGNDTVILWFWGTDTNPIDDT